MSCGSTACTSTNYLETGSSFPDLGWSGQMPLPWLSRIALGRERRYQRRQLLELDDRLLSDIGISRQQAAKEALKSSWERILTWRVR
jgi:uncharacterized protein YjiS (DUF1127 family)